jgi:protein O-mannosyl-transferase
MARARGPQTRAEPPPGRPDLLPSAAPWAALAAILAAAAVAYAPALPGPFVLDDWTSIQANNAIRRPDAVRVPGLAELLGPSRPVTQITFAVDWRAAGLDPRRFHAVGLALHLAATVAAFAWLAALLRRSGHPRPRALALVVAGLFALHPIQAESVAYAAQRAEVLSALLVLAALCLLDRAATRFGHLRGALPWAGGVLAWVAAMGAKTTAIAAPGVFLLDQAAVAPAEERGAAALGRRTRRALALAAPILALAAWSAVLHVRAFEAAPAGGAGFSATPLGAADYFRTQLRVGWLYLRLLAWPSGLAFDRSFPASTGLDAGVLAAGAGVVLLLALAAGLWLGAERAAEPRPAARLAAFGILLWFTALAPTSSFVPVVDLAVEHRVYLASIGAFLVAAVSIDALLARLLPRPRAALAGAALASLALLSLSLALHARARTWASEEALWRESAAASPDNARAWSNLGLALHHRGDVGGALTAYERAWGVVRDPARAASLARNHSAALLEKLRTDDALAVLDRGLALAPDEPSLQANRAAALAQSGRIPEAVAAARLAAAGAPGSPLIRNVLGQALSVGGDPEGAVSEFLAAESLDPGNPLYPVEAAITLAGMGRVAEACAAFGRAALRSGTRALPFDAARRAAALGCPLPGPR